MSNKVGYVKLHRAIMENDMYFREEFTRSSAWFDLLLLTNHRDGNAFIRGVSIPVKRGQLAYAIKTLSTRWKWSQSKVDRYLKWLENEDQIEYTKNNLTTIITIKNWDKYQGEEIETKTKRRPNEDQTKTNKNDKEYIKKNIEERSKDFQSSVAGFLNTYPKETLRNFFDYWTEKNPAGVKMKFEMERTFEVSKRLATWASREKDYKPKSKEQNHTNYSVAN